MAEAAYKSSGQAIERVDTLEAETEERVEGLAKEMKIIKKRLSNNKDVLFSKIEDLSGATLKNPQEELTGALRRSSQDP